MRVFAERAPHPVLAFEGSRGPPCVTLGAGCISHRWGRCGFGETPPASIQTSLSIWWRSDLEAIGISTPLDHRDNQVISTTPLDHRADQDQGHIYIPVRSNGNSVRNQVGPGRTAWGPLGHLSRSVLGPSGPRAHRVQTSRSHNTILVRLAPKHRFWG